MAQSFMLRTRSQMSTPFPPLLWGWGTLSYNVSLHTPNKHIVWEQLCPKCRDEDTISFFFHFVSWDVGSDQWSRSTKLFKTPNKWKLPRSVSPLFLLPPGYYQTFKWRSNMQDNSSLDTNTSIRRAESLPPTSINDTILSSLLIIRHERIDLYRFHSRYVIQLTTFIMKIFWFFPDSGLPHLGLKFLDWYSVKDRSSSLRPHHQPVIWNVLHYAKLLGTDQFITGTTFWTSGSANVSRSFYRNIQFPSKLR